MQKNQVNVADGGRDISISTGQIIVADKINERKPQKFGNNLIQFLAFNSYVIVNILE